MNEQLILIAAGGLARETLEAARAQGHYDVVGVLDDDPALHGSDLAGVTVLGGRDAVADHDDARFVICAGRGTTRALLATSLALPPERYATVVHPSVAVPKSCAIEAGSVLLAGAVATAAVTIGRHVVVMPQVTLTHDDTVEDFATLCAGARLGGGVSIGAAAYVGMGAAIRENVRIGARAVVGMGSVVLGDVPADETWIGVPARRAGGAGHRIPTSVVPDDEGMDR